MTMNVTRHQAAIPVGATTDSTATELAVAPPSDALLPEPATQVRLGDDAIYEIAALLAQSASDDRKHARNARSASEKSIEQQTKKKLEAMRDKADAVRTAATIRGVTGMAAGTITVAGGVSQMSEAAKIQTVGSGQDGALTTGEQAANSKASSRGAAHGSIGSGFGKCFESLGGLAAGQLDAEAEEHEADAFRHGAIADRALRAVEEHTDQMRDARELINKVMDFLKDVRSSQESSAQAALRRG
jgi:hypothetical protein